MVRVVLFVCPPVASFSKAASSFAPYPSMPRER
jgi:hypothetical protein